MRDPMAMERANLLNMAKLSIKGLIESALSFGRTLDSDYPPLQQFFVVMEHCLKHGLKGRRVSDVTSLFLRSLEIAWKIDVLTHSNVFLQWRSPSWVLTNPCGVLWSWWRNCVQKQQRSPLQYETFLDSSKKFMLLRTPLTWPNLLLEEHQVQESLSDKLE